ncbi:MAG TPA: hypothetical protein VGC14_02420 [Rhizobium sp.]
MSEKNEKPVIFDLEEMTYDREMGCWNATFIARSRLSAQFKMGVSMADSSSGTESGGFPQMTPAEVAALRLREKAHKALQMLLEASAQNLRKSDVLLPGASDQ